METGFDIEIEQTLNILQSGGTVVYPTDTIWGMGCDACNADAVRKINAIKSRPSDKSFIILLENDTHLHRYLKEVPEMAWDILDNTTKPTTIIYPGGKNLAPGICAQDGSVGIRIVKDDFCKALLRKLGKPIVSTSANFSGMQAPQNFNEIDPKVLEAVDYVVNLRQKESIKNIQSTIIRLELNGEISFVRK